MENSWQSKCGLVWQQSSMPPPPPLEASSSNEFQNQQEQFLTAKHLSCLQLPQESMPLAREMIQEPIFSNSSSFYKPGNAELGTPYLSLLSGPSSFLPCDLQRLSHPKLVVNSSQGPTNRSAAGSAMGSRVSLLPSWLWLQNMDSQNVKSAADFCPLISSSAIVSSNHDNSTGLKLLQAAELNLWKSELARVVVCENPHETDLVKGGSSLMGVDNPGATSANVSKLQNGANVVASQKVPLEIDFSGCSQTPNLPSGCPRVFCSGTSGDLLLSDTGLLGVVCSCHGFYMSISKFSEHSGLYNVNPANTVCMDNGDTIAHWRKSYFSKVGIRIPEDHKGWDWPEGFSAAPALTNHFISNIPNNASFFNEVCPVGTSGGSGQPQRHVTYLKDRHSGKNIVDGFQYNGKQGNSQEYNSFLFKGFIDTSQSNLHPEDIMCTSNSVGTRGPDKASEPSTAKLDSILKSASPFYALPNFQYVKCSGKGSDVSRNISALREGLSVPSNIESRLGQLPKHSQTLGSSAPLDFGLHLMGTQSGPRKSFFSDRLLHKSLLNGSYRVSEGVKQTHQIADITPNTSERRETVQLNHVPGAYNAFVDHRIDSYNGGVGRGGSVIHPLLSCFKNSEAEVQFRKVNDIANSSHVVTKKPHSEPHASKRDKHCFPWSRVAGNIMESDATMLNAQKHVSKGKGAECAVNNLPAAAELNFGLHKPFKESLSSFNVVPVKSDITFSAFHEKSPTVSPRSSVINNEPNATDTLNNSWKISPLSHTGHSALGYPRSINNTTLSSTSSVCVESTTPALSKKKFSGVNSGILDENMKMLSVQYMLESPNRHAAASVRNLQEPEMLNKPFAQPHVTVGQTISKDHMQVLKGSSVPKMSETVLKSTLSDATCWRGLNNEKLALPTEGTSFHTEAGGVPCRCSCNLHPREKLFLRFGGNKRNITSSEQDVLFQGLPYVYVPEKCRCAVHSHCLAGKYDLKGGRFCDSLNDQEGIVNGRSKSLFRSMLDGNSIFSKEKAISFCNTENLVAKNMETVQSHSFHHVPSEVLETGSSKRKLQQAGSFNSNGNVEDSAVDAAKCFARSSQNAEPLKEQEFSNVSSGCSAPVVTWVSIEVNKRDSSAIDTGDVRCTNNIVVDEGSRIDKSWSSDDSLDSERSADFFGSAPRKRSSLSLVEELRLRDSLKLKKAQNETHASFSTQEESEHVQNFKKSKKMKKTVKWKRLDAAFPASGQSSNNGSSKCTEDVVQNFNSVWNMQVPLGREQKGPNNCACSVEPSIKRRRSRWPSSNSVSNYGDLYRGYQVKQKIESHIHSRVDDDTCESPEILGKKRLKLDGAAATSKNLYRPCCDHVEVTANFTSVDCLSNSLDLPLDFYKWTARPVVFGKYGIISNGNSSKPAKIVPLRRILETARKYDDKNVKAKSTSTKKLKRMRIRLVKETFRNKDVLKSEYHDASNVEKSGTHNVLTVEFEPHHSIGETETAPHCAITGNDEVLHILEKRRNDNCSKNHSFPDSRPTVQLKTKYKEVRKRSLYELIVQGKDSEVANSSIKKNPECLLQTSHRRVGKLMRNSGDDKFLYSEMHNAKRCRKKQLYETTQNLDAFCCVCGSSNKNSSDHLLECNRCLIKVHQACYGISKVPKTQWYCRPCKTNSKNIACVLCGYGEGAMTQALQSQNVVKSLLQAWNAMYKSKINITMSTDNSACQLSTMASGTTDNSACQLSTMASGSDSFPVMRLANMGPTSVSASDMNLSNHLDIVDNSSSPCNSMLQNSITAGVLDSTVKQWVHVVCGLWTPGTHCPNVDTMNAFDVSDTLSSKEHVVCSICSRPGGSCIQCRILDCSACFHPWCAHQKGLLQTEAEGNDAENAGFYGRCMLHSTIQQFIPGSYPINTESLHSREKGLTSARTEGYKHQKHKGFWHKFSQESDGNGSCHVPQEQLNAWVHINRQKPHRNGFSKLPCSRVESDYRKEYARYKHSKGWKNLVVYKSDIHALGLYTSQFISRGAMVVEYVGEIVGLRVADKREREYHSGKKLQYKSACYFFRVDKEHIIDATRKGGIARFVNHSCKPNCVARVLSVRNEKKVVFLAERDIYPGEEITYDYHFNHEDEGEKIPCYCNSKNCRRYLN